MMFIVDRAKCGVFVCVSSVVRSAALGDGKEFNVVLSQEGRAKNPALLILAEECWAEEWGEGVSAWLHQSRVLPRGGMVRGIIVRGIGGKG
jgi:hypothetical protein